MNEVAPTTSMMSGSSTNTDSTSSTGMVNSNASMSPSSGDTTMISPVPASTPPGTDTSAPATAPMTTTDAPTATGSITSLESSIQSAADAALADAQTQAPATTSGATASMSTMSVNSSRDYMSNTKPYSDGESIGATIAGLIYFAVILLGFISQYILSRKLKLEYPWLGLIPVANIYNLVKIAGHDGWKIILLFVPLGNLIYIAFSLFPAISRRTGHGGWTSVGLFFLFPIVFPYIAFAYKGADETLASISPTVPGTPATF